FSLHMTLILGNYASWKEAGASWFDTMRTEMSTLSILVVLAGGGMTYGVWWYAIFTTVPFLIAWEAYTRTNQYVEAKQDAIHDGLTGLLNRRALEESLERLISEHSPKVGDQSDRG